MLKVTELGPCNVTQNLTTVVNENSWSEVSNLLFISQPLGVGFSYSEQEAGKALHHCPFICVLRIAKKYCFSTFYLLKSLGLVISHSCPWMTDPSFLTQKMRSFRQPCFVPLRYFRSKKRA